MPARRAVLLQAARVSVACQRLVTSPHSSSLYHHYFLSLDFINIIIIIIIVITIIIVIIEILSQRRSFFQR